MLEELLKYDRLGNKEELQFVFFEAFVVSETQTKSDLKRYCTSNMFSIGGALDGLLKLLEFMSFIKVSGDVISIDVNKLSFDKARSNNYFAMSRFSDSLLEALKREAALEKFFIPDAIKFNAEIERFYLKENLIPYSFFPLRNLLLAIGYFERDASISNNNLLIRREFNDSFRRIVISEIIDNHQKSKKKKVTIDEFRTNLERQSEAGNNAELYVLDFELARLKGHPFQKGIRHISEEFVNAGYDIESYNDIESILIDRYIEVKSFSEKVSFFWSRNEVETAKELKDKYFLYLVDRKKIEEVGYKPSILQNPYEKIFENEIWKKEVENWKINLHD